MLHRTAQTRTSTSSWSSLSYSFIANLLLKGNMSDINLKTKTHRAKVFGNIWKSRGVGEERNEATRTSNIELSERHQMGCETRPGKWISRLASKEKRPTMSISTGVLLWIIAPFGLAWTFVTIVPLIINALKYGSFIVDTIAEMRKLRKGDQILPAKGIREPPPSIIGGPVAHTRTERSFTPAQRSESPAPVFDTRDVADNNRII
jgi:hypothetical protein